MEPLRFGRGSRWTKWRIVYQTEKGVARSADETPNSFRNDWRAAAAHRDANAGPGLAEPVAIRDSPALAIFRLGTLEDFDAASPLPPQSLAPRRLGAGYQIVRFFYGGDFDFARLTYYPDAQGERGYLYFADGPA